MNAVKRCLALIAATVAIGACSGDPTADLAGADPTIRATPGAVWMTQDKTTTVLIESVDATGAPLPGSWTATTVGPLTATKDPNFQVSSTGGVNTSQQWVIAATAEGEGIVIFHGTGGTDTVRVRVAPAATAFHATLSNLLPAIAEAVTVTAPAGIRFTSGTAVSVVRSAANTANNGLAAPSVLSMSVDSTSMIIMPAPGAAGRLSITGIASIETPTLKSSSITVDSLNVPALATLAVNFSNAAPAANAPVTVTITDARFKFRPTSIGTSGGMAGVALSFSADSTQAVFLPTPGTNAAVSFSTLKLVAIPSLTFSLPTASNLTVGAAPNVGPDDPAGSAVFAAPTVSGTSVGWYDQYSMTQPDPDPVTCDGAAGAQWYTLTVTVTGSYTIKMNWTNGSDFDFGIMVKDGTYGTPGCADYLSTSGLSSAKPEAMTTTLTAGQTYVINAMDFAGNGSGFVQISVKKN